jgi:cytochrome c556
MDVTLILFSVSALFMVPVKRFWERMETLGGGLKGIEGYVDEVHKDLCQKLSEMETSMRQQVSQAQESTQEAVEKAAEDGKKARQELDRLRAELKNLEQELRQASGSSTRVSHNVDALGKRLSTLQDEFASLDTKLEQSVKQRVMESCRDMESTVLSALDAVQEEMLGRPLQRHEGKSPRMPIRPRSTPRRNAGPPAGGRKEDKQNGKIKSLFDNLGPDEQPQEEAPVPREDSTDEAPVEVEAEETDEQNAGNGEEGGQKE